MNKFAGRYTVNDTDSDEVIAEKRRLGGWGHFFGTGAGGLIGARLGALTRTVPGALAGAALGSAGVAALMGDRSEGLVGSAVLPGLGGAIGGSMEKGRRVERAQYDMVRNLRRQVGDGEKLSSFEDLVNTKVMDKLAGIYATHDYTEEVPVYDDEYNVVGRFDQPRTEREAIDYLRQNYGYKNMEMQDGEVMANPGIRNRHDDIAQGRYDVAKKMALGGLGAIGVGALGLALTRHPVAAGIAGAGALSLGGAMIPGLMGVHSEGVAEKRREFAPEKEQITDRLSALGYRDFSDRHRTLSAHDLAAMQQRLDMAKSVHETKEALKAAAVKRAIAAQAMGTGHTSAEASY